MRFEHSIARLSASLTLSLLASLTACSSGRDAASRGAGAEPDTEESVAAGASAEAAAKLQAAYPEAKLDTRAARVRRLYGVAATGASAEAAAESFRASSAAAFGIAPDALVAQSRNGLGLMFDRTTGKHKFRLYTFDQTHEGIPVFGAGMRALVREDGDHAVVWANFDLRAIGAFSTQSGLKRRSLDTAGVDLAKSLAAVQASRAVMSGAVPPPTALKNASAPQATIFAGDEDGAAAPRMAIKYTAEAADGPGKWSFVADAATGDVLHVESALHFAVSGTVSAEVLTGSESMECGKLGVVPLRYANVTSAAGNAVTNANGEFSIPSTATEPVSLVSTVTGAYVAVDDAGETDSLSLTASGGTPANFLHRDAASPPERVLAQLTAYAAVNDVRDLVLAHVPEYPVVSTQREFRVNVNQSQSLCLMTGGAWYDDDSLPHTLNFCLQDGERANTAFRSIIDHEFGHHLVDSAGSGQGEYGEGMSDTVAMLVAKDQRIGVGYYVNRCDTPLRVASNDCQYSAEECSSCGAGLYECGSLISATVWDLWQRLQVTEPQDADAIVRRLVFSSIPLHSGTHIDPSLAIDFLTLDDDDGLLENGTPHYDEICGAFGQHGMSCPPLVNGLVVKGANLVVEGPSDGPFSPASTSFTLHNLGPRQKLSYSVKRPADAPWLSLERAAGSVSLGETASVVASIDQGEAARLADGDYTAQLEFVDDDSGKSVARYEVKLRVGAPLPVYSAHFDGALDGFTVDSEDDNLWHSSSVCVDGLPGHTSPGSLYYARDASCQFTTSTPNFHSVTSPAIELSNPSTAELGFKYFLETENSSDVDRASVLISVNGGEFQTVASNNGAGQRLAETSAWRELRFDIASLLPQTGSVSIRVRFAFHAVTIDSNLKRGFAVDDVTVYAKAAGGSPSN